MTLLNTVANPKTFFERRANDLSVVPAAAIVLLVAVISVVTAYVQVNGTVSAIPNVSEIPTIVFVMTILPVFAISFGGWLLYAAVFHVLGTLIYEAEGSFSKMLAVTGWGYIPQIFGALITLAVTFYVFSIQGLMLPNASNLQMVFQHMQSVMSRPVFQWTNVAMIAVTLWSGFIWINGVSEVQGIEENEAAIVVGVPVVISVLLIIYQLV